MEMNGSKKFKVCIICHGLGNGGIELFVINLAKGLKNNGHDIKLAIAVDDNGIPQFREKEIQSANIEVFKTCDLGSLKRMYKHCMRLYRYLADNKFDVVHSNMNFLDGLNLLVAALAGVKVRIAHSHCSGSESKRSTRFLFKVYSFVMRGLIWLFSTTRCGCSRKALEYCFGASSQKDSHSFVISNGIELGKFQEFPRNPSPQKIVTVGRLSYVKNPQLIISIMRVLKTKGYCLDWVGGGEMWDDITKSIEENGLSENIVMHGHLKDIRNYLAQASVFLLPSFHEGLPISAIEAQAVGLPCVLSDTITHEVDCGLCKFIPLDLPPEEWARQIDALATGEESLHIDEKRLQKFSAKNTLNEVIELYEQYF